MTAKLLCNLIGLSQKTTRRKNLESKEGPFVNPAPTKPHSPATKVAGVLVIPIDLLATEPSSPAGQAGRGRSPLSPS
jgi:hypothetical protein